MKSKEKETIIVFSAHSDDFVIGAGGTIAEYAKEGKKVTCLVLSYGEMSHPWLKDKVVQKMRAEETFEASKIMKCRSRFFNLKEGKFLQNCEGVKNEIEKIIIKENPCKIFTHSQEDPHPDHKATNKITLDIYERLQKKPEVYVYSVWNPVSFKTSFPSLYIDISKTFSLKLKAMHKFTSQKIHAIYLFTFMTFFRALKDGRRIRTRFGEHFFRIK